MWYHFRVGILLKGLRRLVEQHLPVGDPQDLLLFVQRIFQKPHGSSVGFASTSREDNEGAVCW